MSGRSAFDDFRDLLDGRLDAAETVRLRSLINADPVLASRFEAYAAVHAATNAAPAAPATSVTFERLDAARRAGRLRRLRPWMAAAAALLLVAAGLAAHHHFTPPPTVVLRAIPLHAPEVPAAGGEAVPALLADWQPVADGKLRWLPTIDEGRAVARVTGRPILLWIYHPTCPICVGWERTSFRDPEVLSGAIDFVPVRVNAMKAPRELQELFAGDFEHKWPYLAALGEDGATLLEFPGAESATPEAVRENLKKALAARGEHAPSPTWADANAACSATARGEAAFSAGDLGGAWRAFDGVRALHVPQALSATARRRLVEIERSASDALSAAMQLAATDEVAGARSLSDAAERFRGTPYGTDLAEVEQELRATGRLPVLVEATAERK